MEMVEWSQLSWQCQPDKIVDINFDMGNAKAKQNNDDDDDDSPPSPSNKHKKHKGD